MTLAAHALALRLGLSAPTLADGHLKAPVADRTGGAAVCVIIRQTLESEMNYEVKRANMPSGPGVYDGLRAGDLDFACEGRPSYSASKDKYIKGFGGDGSVVKSSVTGIVGRSGHFVPEYVFEGAGTVAQWLKDNEAKWKAWLPES